MFHTVRFRMFAYSVFVSVIVLLALSAPLLAQDTMQSDTSPAHLFSDGSEVTGTWSTLTRYPNGVSTTVHTTGLTPGDVVTVWWVVFNKPEACSDGACGENDVFTPDDTGDVLIGDNGPTANQAQREAAQISILGATGNVIGDNGDGNFAAWLGEGTVPGLIFGPGLTDPSGAEIHLVLRDHGPMQADLFDQQITALWGGCDADWPHTPCQDVQFVMHQPAQ